MQSYAPEDVWSLRPLCALCMTPFPSSWGAKQLPCRHVFCQMCAQESVYGQNLYQCPFDGTQGYLSDFNQSLLQQTEYVIANIQEARNPSWSQSLYQVVTDLKANVNFLRVVCRFYCSSGTCTVYNCPYDHNDMSIRSVPCPQTPSCTRIQVCPYLHPPPQQIPQMGTQMPQMGTQMPQVGMQMPQMGTQMPQMGTQMPQMGTQMPQVGMQMPQMQSQMPQMGMQMPQMGTQMPQMQLQMGTQMPQMQPQMGTQMPQMQPQMGMQQTFLSQQMTTQRGLSPSDMGMAAGQQGAHAANMAMMQTTNVPFVQPQAAVPQGLGPANFPRPGPAAMQTQIVPRGPAFSPNAPPSAAFHQGFGPMTGQGTVPGKIGIPPGMMPPPPQVIYMQPPQQPPQMLQPQQLLQPLQQPQYPSHPHGGRPSGSERPSHFQYHHPARWYHYGHPSPTTVEALAATDKHYKSISALFHQTSSGKTIVKIERIRNYQLYTLYSMKHESFSVAVGRAVAIKQLFHGTRNHDPKVIYESVSGLDSRVGTGMWGQGTYYAVNSSYSVNYAHPLANGDAQMFCCSVIVGDFVRLPSDPSLRKPPANPKGGIYHSVQGNTGGSDIFITYEPAMSYPSFLITFKP